MNKFLAYILPIVLLASCSKYDIEPERVDLEGGEAFTFVHATLSPGKDIYWEFGDGTFSTERNPTHSYTSPGTYKVYYSVYSRNGKFVSKVHRYNVRVTQIERPRVLGADISGENYNYLYKDELAFLNFILPEDIEYSDDYILKLSIDGQELYNGKNNAHTFTDTGYYDLTFEVTDEYGGSGTFDTTVFVGADQTRLNIRIPEVFQSQLGTISEKYVFIYDFEYSFQFDYDDMITYPGPSIGPFISGGEHMYYYGPGPNDYYYSSLSAITYSTLPAVVNGMTDQFVIPSYDNSDIDELYVLVIIVGSNGMSIGYEQLNILPGSNTPFYDIGLSFTTY